MAKNTQSDPETKSIGLLLIDGFALMSYAATVEPLRAANLLSGKELYRLHHFAIDDVSADSSGNLSVAATRSIREMADLDFLFVVAGGNPETFKDDAIFRHLRQLSNSRMILGGVSAGPFLLAKAGVMSDRRMTVHWEHSESLIEQMPNLLLARSLYVIDRDRMTCAGGTAPLDMMHALITGHHGSTFAARISDWFMHTKVRPAGGQQRAGLVERYNTTNKFLISTIEVMENHLADPLSLGQLAKVSGLSKRHLNRLFTGHFQIGTMTFYRRLRLELSHRLCQQSTLSITEIAITCGFSNSAHFSAAFKATFNQSPSELRVKE